MRRPLLAMTLAGLLGGTAAWLSGAGAWADALWAATTALVLAPLLISVVRALLRGHTGVDVIALIAMGAALALGEYLAGALVALMLTGGQALEDYADRRARRDLKLLLDRAPRFVHRYENGELQTVPVEQVKPGERLLVKSGEVIPVDGIVLDGRAVLDASALTGEPRPVSHETGDLVQSGSVNAGGPFDLRTTTDAAGSTYAGVVRLVQEAQAEKAPFVRLADRYALLFLPLTLVMAAGAWLWSGDPVRALAVLVVATPCPLILAAPVAIVGGISRAARRGIIVKGGGALETLARGQILLFDKTGTLTAGMPVLASVETFADLPADEVLRLAASLDQVSPHVLAVPIVRAAAERALTLHFPSDVHEEPGLGVRGKVEGRAVAVGNGEWVAGGPLRPRRAVELRRRTALEGTLNVFVAVDGETVGALVLEDPIRPDAPRVLRTLRRLGISEIVMVTGDHPDVAATVGAALGVDHVLAERSPAEKVETAREARSRGVTIMVGDGLNDAPALAAADVGVAMGARGASASSEAADVVLTVERLDRLPEALEVARRARGIALESVLWGMGLSLVAMGFAAAGFITPVAGAFLQEAIDVAVITNALRSLRSRHRPSLTGDDLRASERFLAEHKELTPAIARIRTIADRLGDMPTEETAAELAELRRFFVEDLVPHEKAEDAILYPAVARRLGGEDPIAALSRSHLEIAHLVRLYTKTFDRMTAEGPTEEDLADFRRILYGLHAVLKLHFSQEEEAYLLVSDVSGP